MPKFELISEYVPRGDQPEAIEKLTEGLQNGYKYQTLLGVTGSGKSVTGDTPVMIFTPDGVGGYTQRMVKIGEFIDKKLREDERSLQEPGNTLISHAKEPYKDYVLSLNPRNCEADIKPITAFIRHEAPEYMYRVKTACGREITVTSDHNLWVLRNGKLQLLPTEKLVETDCIPVSSDKISFEQDILSLKKLLSVRWTKIASIEKIKCEKEYVYDFSVADNETFLAGMGGIFVHNTFTMANIVANVQRPALVISHNKTLAAQLYSEFREFFPKNAVHYFVSFYDWYIPEAYKPQTDTYIEKDTRINEEIDKLRMAATAALMSRRDVIIVASVSCIYGIGSPEQYEAQRVQLQVGDIVRRNDILRSLVDIRYERNDVDFARGRFRARGDVIEVFPAYSETAYRIELFGDEIDRITEIDTLTGEIINEHSEIEIFPARHYMTDEERFDDALLEIEVELQNRIGYFVSENKLLEAQRIEQRTQFDLEMMREVGYCMGIENYSRHLSGLNPGEPPHCLVNFFPDDFLLFIDESHVTIPQIKGMYRGDRSRKKTLVDYGFRLPSALDNRPLRYEEFEKLINQAIFVSATPAEFERKLCQQHGQIAEQIIRPTGLIDPKIIVHPIEGQIDHLIGEINKRIEKNQRILVLTMTKRMAEDLTDYLQDAGIRATYLHSDIETLERPQILRDLRQAKFDVLVGINLLREGLDLPEVTMVAILDADRQGFLRTETSLIQMAGRAARNVDGEVILYANDITDAMRNAMRETERRRQIQMEYNEQHGITPESIQKSIVDMLPSAAGEEADWRIESQAKTPEEMMLDKIKKETASENLQEIIDNMTQEMQEAAANLEFERAAALRDQIMELKQELGQG